MLWCRIFKVAHNLLVVVRLLQRPSCHSFQCRLIFVNVWPFGKSWLDLTPCTWGPTRHQGCDWDTFFWATSQLWRNISWTGCGMFGWNLLHLWTSYIQWSVDVNCGIRRDLEMLLISVLVTTFLMNNLHDLTLNILMSPTADVFVHLYFNPTRSSVSYQPIISSKFAPCEVIPRNHVWKFSKFFPLASARPARWGWYRLTGSLANSAQLLSTYFTLDFCRQASKFVGKYFCSIAE